MIRGGIEAAAVEGGTVFWMRSGVGSASLDEEASEDCPPKGQMDGIGADYLCVLYHSKGTLWCIPCRDMGLSALIRERQRSGFERPALCD